MRHSRDTYASEFDSNSNMPFHRSPPEGGSLCAIFVHAGAGFHSHANEKLHLGVVNDAAKVGMAVLKNGGSAVDAVEMAIRLLEDRELTNAGYGSNLTVNGHVECDAIMVDHLGRSGAAGCVSQVKNPIAVARLVLDASSQILPLQRVPPNLLVGNGATEFAAEQGLSILPHDYLVSQGAHSRWLSWKQDLIDIAAKEDAQRIAKQQAYQAPRRKDHKMQRRDSVLNRPNTSSTTPSSTQASNFLPLTSFDVPTSTQPVLTTYPTTQPRSHEPDPSTISKHAVNPLSYQDYAKVSDAFIEGVEPRDAVLDGRALHGTSPAKRKRFDRNDELEDIPGGMSDDDTISDPDIDSPSNGFGLPSVSSEREDHITDTVGVIAVDCYGNIAAGASSGGIGMKHSGRCGPAALNGVGIAVIPIDKDDPLQACVATVTSGTGEHMATTMAAATAANRVYLGVRKHGPKLKSCDESEALRAMIETDFMEHPGVKNQPCVGALGVLAVKKTRNGIYFHFCHNTESFAIASMHSDDTKAVCVMSRSKGNSSLAQGGRASHHKKFRS